MLPHSAVNISLAQDKSDFFFIIYLIFFIFAATSCYRFSICSKTSTRLHLICKGLHFKILIDINCVN